MSSFTTEHETPNREDCTDNREIAIESTRGVWIRHANSGDYEVYFNGRFIISYGVFNASVAAAIAEHLYDEGVRQGKAANAKQMREALGIAQ